jgi:aromatic-L-amino-acid/L-tryptophan decarboxylase
MPQGTTPSELLFDTAEHDQAWKTLGDFSKRYLASLPDLPVFPDIDRPALRVVMDAPLPRLGVSMDDLIKEFEAVIVPNATHTAHPRFLPYVQPTPNAIAPYADAIASLISQNCNLWHLSPSANAVEQCVVRWFSGLFGFPKTAGGLITSGGSAANFVALAAARDNALGPEARVHGLQGRGRPLTLYTSDEVHSSIDKAVSMLGIGTGNLRRIPADDAFRIRLDLLAEAVRRDREEGKQPFCVVASAGTVTTGAVDPIAELSAFCRMEQLWLHVDGAYGALSALSGRFRKEMAPVGLADSVSLDPHKFLFCPAEAGCVVVRDRSRLQHAFSAAPSYLTMSEDPDFVDYANHGPQLTRSFKAFKVWWSLKRFGADAYVRVIDRMADLAVYMARLIEDTNDLELLAPVTLNCVCFRVRRLDDAGNRAVLGTLVDSGDAFLGPARVKGRFGIRACFMNLRTSEADVEFILDQVTRIAAQKTSMRQH